MKMRRHNNIRIYFDIMIFKMLRQKPYEIVLLSFLLKNRLFINPSRYHMIYVGSAFSASSTRHCFTPFPMIRDRAKFSLGHLDS